MSSMSTYKRFLKRGLVLPSNVIIVSEFPKSGVTWLSFILANLILQDSDKLKPSFFNLRTIIPELGQYV